MSTVKIKISGTNELLIEYVECAEQSRQRRVVRSVHKELCRVLGTEPSFVLHFF